MCGIAGIFRPEGRRDNGLTDRVVAMTATLAHRGPDAGDTWTDPECSISLGHRRLAVLELSAAGAQPMQSDCSRFSVTFNGEIYNHLDIRRELEANGGAPRWRGSSDTETLLYAIRYWGIEGALQRFNGMFAFGVWDARDRALTLCRDRFGEKPLFYGWIGRDVVFASELKAFRPHPEWHPVIDRRAMTAFMRYAYVPAPWTIWQGIRKLEPGSFVTIAQGTGAGYPVQPTAYWSMRDSMVQGQRQRLDDPVAATDELERLLSSAVRRQSLSDVPLGAFLSGGIDSSTIVALMQRQSPRPVKTFSIGFAEAAFNEADHARGVARHLATDHTELVVSPSDARDAIPRLVEMADEPFADSSQIPTLLVAALARRSVTVSLSGDGGDELFGGYNRHVWGGRLQAQFGSLPGPAKRLLGGLLGMVAPEPANSLALIAGKVLPARFRVLRAGDQIVKVARILGSRSFDEMYRKLSSIDDDPAAMIVTGEEPQCWFSQQMKAIEAPLDPLDRMTLSDALSYLPDDILQKVDRAAMSVSLETRVPFLDRDVAEFSCRLPPHMKVRDGRGKWIVREVLRRHVPDRLIDRPKTGFGIPLDDWLRGPLRPWASDLLSPARLERQGLFNSQQVTRIWNEHQNTSVNHGHRLWNVLMAQSWAGKWTA